jgi:hypothetical protein
MVRILSASEPGPSAAGRDIIEAAIGDRGKDNRMTRTSARRHLSWEGIVLHRGMGKAVIEIRGDPVHDEMWRVAD